MKAKIYYYKFKRAMQLLLFTKFIKMLVEIQLSDMMT